MYAYQFYQMIYYVTYLYDNIFHTFLNDKYFKIGRKGLIIFIFQRKLNFGNDKGLLAVF